MAKFTDEDKVERTGNGSFFGVGVHKVQIEDVDAGTSPKGSEFFEFTLIGENSEEGKARVYFTDASKGFSFNTIRSIFVHNSKTEKAKEAARAKVDTVEDTDELLTLCQALRGKECWLLVEETGETYTSPSNGKEYPQLNRNIFGYEPTPRPKSKAALVDEAMGKGEPVNLGEEGTDDEPFPFK